MGGRPPPQNLAVYETKLAKIRLPKIQKIALCRVRPPQIEIRAARPAQGFMGEGPPPINLIRVP